MHQNCTKVRVVRCAEPIQTGMFQYVPLGLRDHAHIQPCQPPNEVMQAVCRAILIAQWQMTAHLDDEMS